MLAFLDSPVQLIIAAVVILVVFGPNKLPEIAGQLGRALRELKRTTSDLQDTFKFDDTDHHRYDQHYNPPSYDSYGNPTDTATATVPDEDVYHYGAAASSSHPAIAAYEEPRGDFAASAMSDTSSDYGIGLSHAPESPASGATSYADPAADATPPDPAPAGGVTIQSAPGSVARNS